MVHIDFDGVILNFEQRLKEYLGEKGKTYYPDNQLSYAYDIGDLGCSKEDVYACFNEYDFFSGLQFYDGVISSLNLLRSNGIEIHAYTSTSENGDIYEYRRRLIKKLKMKGNPYRQKLNNFQNTKTYMQGYDSKPVVLETDALFEDNLGIILHWMMRGANTRFYLIDKPYNRFTGELFEDIENGTLKGIDLDKIIRVSSFEEAVIDYINKIGGSVDGE